MRQGDDDYGDWLYERQKDRQMDVELELRESFNDNERLLEGAIKHAAWDVADRYAAKMSRIAERLGNSYLRSRALKADQRLNSKRRTH